MANIPPRTAKTQQHRQMTMLSVVGAAGFEPTTPCTPSKCATGLRHVPGTSLVKIRKSCVEGKVNGGPKLDPFLKFHELLSF
jgi:hypothetical protein